MTCNRAKESITMYLYDEMAGEDREALEAHLESCQECSRCLAEERRFLQRLSDRPPATVPETLLAECRHDLTRAVYRAEKEQAARHPLARWWAGLFPGPHPMRPAWQPLGALVLLAVGFYLGRIADGRSSGHADFRGEPIISQASLFPAVAPGDVQSVEVDPVGGNVMIVVEEVTRRTISGSPRDPGIRGLLIGAMRDYPTSGVRLETLDALAPRAADREVRDALLTAMLHDGNPGVRLKALETLRPLKEDPAVRAALVQALQRDENPGMRVQAIEILTENPNREMVGLLQEVVEREPNNYVRLRCLRTLYDLNASVDRF